MSTKDADSTDGTGLATSPALNAGFTGLHNPGS